MVKASFFNQFSQTASKPERNNFLKIFLFHSLKEDSLLWEKVLYESEKNYGISKKDSSFCTILTLPSLKM